MSSNTPTTSRNGDTSIEQAAAANIASLTFEDVEEARIGQRRSAFKKLVEMLLTERGKTIFTNQKAEKANKVITDKKIEKVGDAAVKPLKDGILEAKFDARQAMCLIIAFSVCMFEVRDIPKPVFGQTCKNHISAVKTWFDEEAEIEVNGQTYKKCRRRALHAFIKLSVETGEILLQQSFCFKTDASLKTNAIIDRCTTGGQSQDLGRRGSRGDFCSLVR